MKYYTSSGIAVLFILISINCKDNSSRCYLEVSILHIIGSSFPPNTIVATDLNGQEPYSYIWSTGSTSFHTTTDSTITMYSVTVTDAEGCVAIDTLDFRDCPMSIFQQIEFTKPAKINGRCWLNAAMQDTTLIPEVINQNEWANQTGPAWCYYENNFGNNFYYGRLFNWYAVASGKICPRGYHVPTQEEWQELIDFLGGNSVAGKEMKDSFLWENPFVGVQQSAFDAQPAGRRDDQGQFMNIGKEAFYWTSSETSLQSDSAYAISLFHSSPQVLPKTLKKTSGLSCKCIAN